MLVVVFANGRIEDASRAVSVAARADLILAADGGARHCLALGLWPAAVVGDIDSLQEEDRQRLEANEVEFIRHPRDKDETDLELALGLAVARGASRIVVLGAMGGRMDMTVANILLLIQPDLADTGVELWHADQTAHLIRPPGGALLGSRGDMVSLIAISGDVHGMTTFDLQYELEDETLAVGPARGVSNIITGTNPRVEIREGALLAIHTPNERNGVAQ